MRPNSELLTTFPHRLLKVSPATGGAGMVQHMGPCVMSPFVAATGGGAQLPKELQPSLVPSTRPDFNVQHRPRLHIRRHNRAPRS